jgi:hypothetical protein
MGLSAVLFIKNKKILSNYERSVAQEKSDALTRPGTNESYDWWMRDIFTESIYDIEGRKVDLDNKSISVLLLFSERAGCGSCLQLEATAWQAFLNQEQNAEKVAVKLVCTVGDVEMQRQEFKAMHIDFPIHFVNSESFLEKLSIQWTPRILFIYKGRILGGYTAEMFNREKSMAMMAKFKEFVNLN